MDATDIVDVVQEFVTLRRSGANYKGLCPFHNEKTPSFSVSPARQTCKCFSCGKGGNAVHFLMEIEQLTYPEAIKWLGRKYGIEVREKELTDEERKAENERESMYVVNDWARGFFQDTLHNSVDGVAKGLAYFRSRGFRDDTIKKFQLGFSPDEREALPRKALAAGYTEEYLLKTGLCYKTDDGKLCDRYRGRVIFPVHTVSGRVVAFGGRILGSDKKLAKYVNSPESAIYSKSNELYGLFLAKAAIVRKGRCFLVEGYTDVISMHQSGVENVVASSGTSLTEGQIHLLHRFTDNITVLYDGDSAGIKASLRGIDMLLSEGLNVKVLLLPDGDDPDSFARKHTAEEFQAYIDEHQTDFIKFKANLLMDEAEGDPIKRAGLVSNVVQSISVIPDPVVRQMYIHECATLLSVDEALIVNGINKLHRERKYGKKQGVEKENETPPSAATPAALPAADAEAEERLLVSLVVRYGELPVNVDGGGGAEMETSAKNGESDGENGEVTAETLPVARYIAEDLAADGLQLRTPLCRRVLEEAVARCGEPGWHALPYFTAHPDAAVSALAAQLGEDSFVLSTRQREMYVEEKYRLDEVVPRLLHDYKHAVVKSRLKQLLAEMRDPATAADKQHAERVMREYMELSSVERSLAQVLGDRVVLC